MIRKLNQNDLNAVIEIWYNASVKAHNFITSDYWQEKKEDMKNLYIPSSNTFVYEYNNQILGFISLVDNYIAAIFVANNVQGKGIGQQLMQFAKDQFFVLQLGVYAKNYNAISFYCQQGFKIIQEKIDEPTGEIEVVMEFKNDAKIK